MLYQRWKSACSKLHANCCEENPKMAWNQHVWINAMVLVSPRLHSMLPRLTQTYCQTSCRAICIHDWSKFSATVLVPGLTWWKPCYGNWKKSSHRTSRALSCWLWKQRNDEPRENPSIERSWLEQLKAIAGNECCMKGGKECHQAPTCCHYVPTWWPTFCSLSACAQKDNLCGTVVIARILTCLDQCHGVRSLWQKLLPKAGAKELSYKSLNLIHDSIKSWMGPYQRTPK